MAKPRMIGMVNKPTTPKERIKNPFGKKKKK